MHALSRNLLAALTAAGLYAAPLAAQSGDEAPAASSAQEKHKKPDEKHESARGEHAGDEAILKGSKLVGAPLHDRAGEQIGAVHDLVLDERGRIVAALLECETGDAELDGYVPVPPDLLSPRSLERSPEGEGATAGGPERTREQGTPPAAFEGVTLDATASQLRGAPRAEVEAPLDEDRLVVVYEYFTIPVFWEHEVVEVEGEDGKTAGRAERTRVEPAGATRIHGRLIAPNRARWTLASEMMDARVVDEQGQDLGEIRDLAVSSTDREVTRELIYAVLESGGLLGMGGKRFAVPLDAFEATDEGRLKVRVTASELELEPGFDGEAWPRAPDARLFAKAGPRTHEPAGTDGNRE